MEGNGRENWKNGANPYLLSPTYRHLVVHPLTYISNLSRTNPRFFNSRVEHHTYRILTNLNPSHMIRLDNTWFVFCALRTALLTSTTWDKSHPTLKHKEQFLLIGKDDEGHRPPLQPHVHIIQGNFEYHYNQPFPPPFWLRSHLRSPNHSHKTYPNGVYHQFFQHAFDKLVHFYKTNHSEFKFYTLVFNGIHFYTSKQQASKWPWLNKNHDWIWKLKSDPSSIWWPKKTKYSQHKYFQPTLTLT